MTSRLNLVHIPKNGGTSFHQLPLVKRWGHEFPLSQVPDPAVVILRDPVERFRSAFDMYVAQRHTHQSIDEFMERLDENLSQDWPGYAFRPQTWWVDEPEGRDLIVFRTEWLDDLYGDMLPGIGSIRRNESRPKWAYPPPIWWQPTRLLPKYKARIRRRYAADYELLEQLCNH